MMMGERSARAQTQVYGDLIRGMGAGTTGRTFALWSTQHDTGEMRSTFEAPNKLRVDLSGFDDTSREFCLMLGGYLAGTLSINGITDGSVQKLSCRLWGDDGLLLARLVDADGRAMKPRTETRGRVRPSADRQAQGRRVPRRREAPALAPRRRLRAVPSRAPPLRDRDRPPVGLVSRSRSTSSCCARELASIPARPTARSR